MAYPRTELQKELYGLGYKQVDVANYLGRSTIYVGQRLRLQQAWTVDEAYQILKLIKKQPGDIFIYFPPKGGKR